MADTTTRTGRRDLLAAPWPSRRMRLSSARRVIPSMRFLLVASLILATALVYAPSSIALGELWSDGINRSYSHGFLLLLTSMWLLARDRPRLDAAALRPEPLALPALLVASAAWLICWRAAVQDLHLLLLPVLALIAVLAAFGRPTARIAAFPLLFLDFAMPIWGNVRDPLQHLSALAVGAMVWLTGLPAVMAGNIIHLPAGSLEIAEGCSGVNFMMVSLAMGTLYGELHHDPARRRLLWIGFLGGLALVANWLRIYLIAVIGYASEMQSPLVADHYWFGWALYAVFFAGFLWIAQRLSRAKPAEGRAHGMTSVAALDPTVESGDSVASGLSRRPTARAAHTVPFVAALACLALPPLIAYVADSLRSPAGQSVAIEWPLPTSGWVRLAYSADSEAGFPDWSPEFVGAATSRRRYVAPDGEPVELFVATYRTQRQSAKLVGYGDSLLGPNGEGEDSARLQLSAERVAMSRAGRWREMTVLDPSGAKSLIWSKYLIGARAFVRPRMAQLWYGIAALAGEPVSSLLAARTACEPSCDAARQRLAAASQLLPSVHATDAAREGGGTP